MQKANQSTTSPFRQKIFDLMKQKEISKLIKASKSIQNKHHTSHSQLKQFSMNTQSNESMNKTSPFNNSSSIFHFKSVQQRINTRNSPSNEKVKTIDSGNKQFSKDFIEQQFRNNKDKPIIKKVSFIQQEFYEQFDKTNRSKNNLRKNKSLPKNLLSKTQRIQNCFKQSKNRQNQSSSIYSKNSKNSKSKSKFNLKNKTISTSNKSLLSKNHNKSLKSLKYGIKDKQDTSQSQNYDSNYYDKQTQKKNYLLHTLKKMQSVRKNLSKTFQQYEKQRKQEMFNFTQRSIQEQDSKNNTLRQNSSRNKSSSRLFTDGSKSKSKRLFVQSHRMLNRIEEAKGENKSKSKSKTKRSTHKSHIKNDHKSKSKNKLQSINQDIYHKKTPVKSKNNSSLYNKTNHQLSTDKSGDKIQTKRNQKSLHSKQFTKNLISSLRHPQKWQTLLKNDLISLHYRIIKRKLIQIQIHIQNYIQKMNIQLHKQNLICQSLKQSYEKVKPKEIITLLCSVRNISLDKEDELSFNLFLFPKLEINISTVLENNMISFNKLIELPYCWLMLVEPQINVKFVSSSKKHNPYDEKFAGNSSNRIKTRSTLSNIILEKQLKKPAIIDILSFLPKPNDQPVSSSTKKMVNNQSKFKKVKTNNSFVNKSSVSENKPKQQRNLFEFQFNEEQFKLEVILNGSKDDKKRTYSLQLQGKGQKLMEKILLFLEKIG